MGLFGLFESKAERKRREAEQRARREDLDLYPGMRVEISTDDGRLFLAAELLELRGDRAKLRTFIDGNLLTRADASIHVTMRGYSSKRNGAVVAEAQVRNGSGNIWYAEHLALVEHTDDRASFRMDVDLEGIVVPMVQPHAPEELCRLLNISTGGARISMESRRDVGDKFLLRTRLFPDEEDLELVCQIVRVHQHRYDYFEYGCRFPEQSPEDRDRILWSIFMAQR